MQSKTKKGVLLALSAAGLLLAGVTPSLYADATMVKCTGLKKANGCPSNCGQGGRKRPDNITDLMSKEECTKAGGIPISLKETDN